MDRDTVTMQRGEQYVRSLVVEQSSDGVTWTPVNLTGYHYLQQVRTSKSESADLLLTIRDDDTNAYATLGGVAGTVDIVVPVADALAVPVGNWVHDWALVQPSNGPNYQARGPWIAEGRVSVEATS